MKTTKASRGRRPSWLVALFSALLILLFSVTMAAAHETSVTSSDPADGATVTRSPDQVTAQFSEELDTKGSTMIVVDAAGKQVSDGNGKVDLDDPDHMMMIATLPAPVGDGVYTVQWHAVLTDGDASDGTFKFTVQSAASPAQGNAVASPAPEATMPAPMATVEAASVAPAQPTAAASDTLPPPGDRARWPVGWLLAGLGAVLAAAVLIVLQRRGAR